MSLILSFFKFAPDLLIFRFIDFYLKRKVCVFIIYILFTIFFISEDNNFSIFIYFQNAHQ